MNLSKIGLDFSKILRSPPSNSRSTRRKQHSVLVNGVLQMRIDGHKLEGWVGLGGISGGASEPVGARGLRTPPCTLELEKNTSHCNDKKYDGRLSSFQAPLQLLDTYSVGLMCHVFATLPTGYMYVAVQHGCVALLPRRGTDVGGKPYAERTPAPQASLRGEGRGELPGRVLLRRPHTHHSNTCTTRHTRIDPITKNMTTYLPYKKSRA